MTSVLVTGTGMVPFRKPSAGVPYDTLAREAARLALADAGVEYAHVQQAYVGFVYGDSTAGQHALYALGLTGIPIVNVNNNCSTGSTALFLARQAIEGGAAECVLALGFEQMNPGALGVVFADRPSPFTRFDAVCDELARDAANVPLALRYFGGAGREHMQRYGTKLATFAKIRAKASRHAEHNENAIFRRVLTEDDVLADVPVWPGVMTRSMACPPTCGAAAAVLVSPAFAKRHGVREAVRIRAQALTTDTASTFESRSMMSLVGYDMARAAADAVYAQAGVGPADIDVCELHDCFAHNELISYESLRLCGEGDAEACVESNAFSYGGRTVVNPSGGLLSKGHPLGATGLAQCHELVQQLRGRAGPRQVEDARLALQHNVGLGGACIITLYEIRFVTRIDVMRRSVILLLSVCAMTEAADAPRERSVVFDQAAAQALSEQMLFSGTVYVEGVDPDARRFRRRPLEQVFAEGLVPPPRRRLLTPLVATPCHSVAASQVPIGTSFAPLAGCP